MASMPGADGSNAARACGSRAAQLSHPFFVHSWLREMRDLHTLDSYIRLADAGNEQAATQLGLRIGTLKRGEVNAQWNAR